jgi:CII-binding regulator of phage lambda lysogenization HflD
MNVAPSPQVQYIDETETTGNSAFKYVTKKVLMKDAAQELKIFVDIYRDVTADFDIYVKPIEAHETRTEETLKWTKVDLLDKTLSSNSVSDYLEYEISCSVDCSTWKANLEFIGYRVKIVGKTSNYAKPPMFKNLRTIAVT